MVDHAGFLVLLVDHWGLSMNSSVPARIGRRAALAGAAGASISAAIPASGAAASGAARSAATRSGPAGSGRTFAITGATVFDGLRSLGTGAVVVQDARILAAGPDIALPRGIEVVDGRGKTVLPGLIDAHVHAFGLDADPVRFGVTAELDMFTFPERLGRYREQRESTAPTRFSDLWTAGTLLTVPGGHGTEYGPIPTVAPDAGRAQIARFVGARLAEGSDYIKVIKDDGTLFGGRTPTLSDEQLGYAIEAAHARGARCVVHVVRQRDARIALEAGADGLAHVPADPMRPEVVDLARRSGAFVTATLSVFNTLSCAGEADRVLRDPSLAPYLSQQQRDGLNTRSQCKPGLFDAARDNVRALHAAGVPILAGTDVPNPGTARGVSLLSELGLLVDAGLCPLDALRSATGAPARRFGLRGRGVLEPGGRADLVLTDGDATSDIGAVRDMAAVWRNGRLVDRAA